MTATEEKTELNPYQVHYMYILFAYTNNYIELNEKYNQDISGRNDFMWRHKSQVFVQFSWLLFSERQ